MNSSLSLGDPYILPHAINKQSLVNNNIISNMMVKLNEEKMFRKANLFKDISLLKKVC